MRRILGIDPGSRVTGYGIIVSDGIRSRHVASGSIRLGGEDFPVRLGEIFRRITGLVAEYAPEELAIEQVFVSRNPSSALKLGQARGAAICAAVVAGLPVCEYTPRMIKQSVVGTGSADKEQVQHMVQRLLGLQERPAADQADALAVAISHAHSDSMRLRVGMYSAGRRL
ncbi:MAG: crossover junction endodeoxyribonuclease RuvC [Chromatiaceae bacterium]|nr:crossover junction endodeoxyribonuclease RuvC [Gammaproteobacteria bacterium]MCP5446342.1 crossover junction endodeoxyribonuclease RuvC [Chromatiaceae bacterium]